MVAVVLAPLVLLAWLVTFVVGWAIIICVILLIAWAIPDSPPEQSADPAPPSSPEGDCHPSYTSKCLDPSAEDYDCEDGTGNGPEYVTGPVEVDWNVEDPDPFGLDRDRNGTACDTLSY